MVSLRWLPSKSGMISSVNFGQAHSAGFRDPIDGIPAQAKTGWAVHRIGTPAARQSLASVK